MSTRKGTIEAKTEVKANCSLASPCGLYCGECLYFKEQCQGCVPSDGRPSWGKCRTYACAETKNVEHCGECSEFPCALFLKQYSHALGPWRVFYKAGQLVYRKKIGTTAWVREKAKGVNPDPKVAVERHLLWEKEQKKQNKEPGLSALNRAASKAFRPKTRKRCQQKSPSNSQLPSG